MAAVLACGEGAVLSHRSAAALWGIRKARNGPVEVTVPSTAGRTRRAGITLHRSTTLTASSCTQRLGLPVTTAARTLADVRPLISPAQLAAAVREAEFLRLVSGEMRSDRSRTELEHRFLTPCRRHRLPQPAVNATVDRYEVDFLWPPERLIVELDGWESHRTRSAFESDRARDAHLSVLGFRVVRLTWRKVETDPRDAARTVRRLLRGR